MGNNKSREIELEELIHKDLASIDDYFELGNIYLRHGYYHKLIEIYGKLLMKPLSYMNMARVYHEEGEAFLRQSKLEESKILFHKSLQSLISCGYSYESIFCRGLNNYNLFKYATDLEPAENYANEALKYFKLLLANFPNDQDNHMIFSYIADIYLTLGDHKDALTFYKKALELEPTDREKAWIFAGIASVYLQKKEYDKSLNYFNEALRKAEISKEPASRIYFDIGILFFEQDQLNNAKNAFLEALGSKDTDHFLKQDILYDADILWHLATIAYRTQDFENAFKYCVKVLELIDDSHCYYADTHLMLGHYYSWTDDYEKASEHYNQVIVAPIADSDAREMAKSCLSQLHLDG